MIRFSHAELDRRIRSLEEAFAELRGRVDRLEETPHWTLSQYQTELADAAGTTQRAISYYENAMGYPPGPKLKTSPTAGSGALLSALPDKDQRAVIRLINSLASPRGWGSQKVSVRPSR